ncbi:MAG TPA: ABC transporter ATP-binding protein [Hyphomicrobiaceae bacterium]|jgi:branched-chain amino acid transport system ATP-binding protein
MPAGRIELVLDGVSAGYAGTSVLERVSFSVGEGERVGLIGRNGAGKTTTLAAIMGLAQLLSGRVLLNGADIGRLATYKRARAGLGYVPQTRDVFPSLTVDENLQSAMNGGQGPEAIAAAYRLFPKLSERRGNAGGQLSGGEQQMLSVARALVARPKILLLDEPLEGLAPQVREELMDAIRRLADETGVGCVLVEQHVDIVLDFATKIVVLERGVPVFVGPTADLRARPAVLDRAIGLDKVPG